MKIVLRILLLMFLIGTSFNSLKAQHVFTAGPTIHFNFSKSKTTVSYGFEVAYWDVFGIPYGADLGVEFEKSTFRVYTEAQTGLYFGGISAGPYFEKIKGSPLKAGLQTSLWANAIVGINIRGRFTRGEDTFAPGLYAKYFWTQGGDLWDKWKENHEYEEGESSGGDWDWD